GALISLRWPLDATDRRGISRIRTGSGMALLKRYLSLALAFAALAAPAAPQDGAASVVAIQSVERPFADTLLLRGRTEATRRVDVRAETTGLVISERLLKGSLVEKGQVLCRVDQGDRAAEMAMAQAMLKEAEIEADTAKRLADRGVGAENTVNTREAALESARAQVLRAQLGIDRLEIKAPFAGVLESDTAELGSFLQNGSVCATMITLNPIKLVAFAPERSVDALKEGAMVQGRLITGRQIEGEITYVAKSADRDTRTYLVEAQSPNADLTIRDGMTTELLIVLQGRPAHILPQTALTLDDEGALGVRLAIDGEARFAPVQIMRDETEGVWVAGLPPEAAVIVVGQEFVTDGQKLDVKFMDIGVTQ
ncbi:MAG: efflux RND transporter periplasmic adaptor subunit, partial [Pseudomonadota bacterium]